MASGWVKYLWPLTMTAFVVKAAAWAIRAGQERISVPLLESMLRADRLRAA
jgi:hypothetical protein